MYWKTDCAILVLKNGNRNIIGASAGTAETSCRWSCGTHRENSCLSRKADWRRFERCYRQWWPAGSWPAPPGHIWYKCWWKRPFPLWISGTGNIRSNPPRFVRMTRANWRINWSWKIWKVLPDSGAANAFLSLWWRATGGANSVSAAPSAMSSRPVPAWYCRAATGARNVSAKVVFTASGPRTPPSSLKRRIPSTRRTYYESILKKSQNWTFESNQQESYPASWSDPKKLDNNLK